METVIGLCLLLLGACHGMEPYCDGRQNRTQCCGALGGSVVVQLMNNTSEIYRYEWKKNKEVILSGKRNKIESNLTGTRFSFTPSNGTFRINNLNRNDSGEYILETFHSTGRQLEPRTLQLLIQAPVSSVLLVSECLSQGEMRVSCSSEGGDSPQYSWTLDGHSLTDAELLSKNNETNDITLKQNVSGRLVCSVRNNISFVSNETKISSCGFIFINCTSDNGTRVAMWVLKANNTLCISTTPAPTTSTATGKTVTTVSSTNGTETSSSPSWYIIMAGVLVVLVILVLAGMAVIYTQKKKKDNKPKEETDEQELTYADVRIMQRQGQQVQPRADVEVEYGQVKFSARPRQSVAQTRDECVYAAVRKGR